MKSVIIGGKENFLQLFEYDFVGGELVGNVRNGTIIKTTNDVNMVSDFIFNDGATSYYIFLEDDIVPPWEISVPILEPMFDIVKNYYSSREVYYNLSRSQQYELYKLLEKIWIDTDMENILKKCVK